MAVPARTTCNGMTRTAPETRTKPHAAPPAASAYPDEPAFLKTLRDFEVDRKITRKAAEWKMKRNSRDMQLIYCPRAGVGKPLTRLHMTMHVKGGWGVQLDERDAADAHGDTDWVADVEHRPAAREVPLEQLLKPGKPRKARNDGDFELVPGMPSVIALDDAPPLEPEVEEPWEELDMDDLDDHEDSRDESRVLSYAEIAATAT